MVEALRRPSSDTDLRPNRPRLKHSLSDSSLTSYGDRDVEVDGASDSDGPKFDVLKGQNCIIRPATDVAPKLPFGHTFTSIPEENFLRSLGLIRKPMLDDGFSFYRALADYLCGSQEYSCVMELRRRVNEDLEMHYKLQRVRSDTVRVDRVHDHVRAAADVLGIVIRVYRGNGKSVYIYDPWNPNPANEGKEILLYEAEPGCYDRLVPTSEKKNMGIVQSILYRALYKEVFGLSNKFIDGAIQFCRETENCQKSPSQLRAARTMRMYTIGSSTVPVAVVSALDPAKLRDSVREHPITKKKPSGLSKPDDISRRFLVGSSCQARDGGKIRSARVLGLEGPSRRLIQFLDGNRNERRLVDVSDLRTNQLPSYMIPPAATPPKPLISPAQLNPGPSVSPISVGNPCARQCQVGVQLVQSQSYPPVSIRTHVRPCLAVPYQYSYVPATPSTPVFLSSVPSMCQAPTHAYYGYGSNGFTSASGPAQSEQTTWWKPPKATHLDQTSSSENGIGPTSVSAPGFKSSGSSPTSSLQSFSDDVFTANGNGYNMPVAPNITKEEASRVDTSVRPSIKTNGVDLPLKDILTLRYFFNLGVKGFEDVMRGSNSCSAAGGAVPGSCSPPHPSVVPFPSFGSEVTAPIPYVSPAHVILPPSVPYSASSAAPEPHLLSPSLHLPAGMFSPIDDHNLSSPPAMATPYNGAVYYNYQPECNHY